MKVLVVDDAPYIRRGLTEKLTKLGHYVIEARDGEEAVEKNSSENPDVIFMDIVMPKMDGLTAIKELKKKNSGKIVVYTANFNKKLLIEALMAGASEYLIKPFDENKIEQAVSCMA